MKMFTHENEWPWGKTVCISIADGAALVEMSFENDNPGICYISGLSVVPSKRRNGLATILMKQCIDYCKKMNCVFRLDLNSVLEPFVMDFYHKLGFIDLREKDGYMGMYMLLNQK